MFKAGIVCFALGLIFIPLTYADEGTHRQRAEKLIGLMNVRQNIEKSFEVIKQMQLAQFNRTSFPEEDQGDIQTLQTELVDLISDELNWEKIKEDYIRIYTETFTEEELKGIIRFYESAIGQRFVEKTPELMNKSGELSQKLMKEIVPKIQRLTNEFLEKHQNPPGHPSSPKP